MLKFIKLLVLAPIAVAAAQGVSGRYIVEFQTEPAVRVAVAKAEKPGAVSGATSGAAPVRYSPADPDVIARRAQIRAEHTAVEQAIAGLGGLVVGRYDTAFNGLAVSLPEASAQKLAQLPGVLSVYPDRKRLPALDHAVNVHRISEAWILVGGQSTAGTGVKIAILDTGIDAAHPGFQGFSATAPSGFPIACDYGKNAAGSLTTCANSSTELANTNAKVIVSRDYTGTGGVDTQGHGTGAAMIAAGLTNTAVFDVPLPGGGVFRVYIDPITGVAPGAWLGNYKVCSAASGCLTSWFLQAVDDAINDGMNVINYSVSGADTASTLESTGPESTAITNALAATVPVVVAAGDDGLSAAGGQSAGTIGDPAAAPDSIAVGAIGNERAFEYSVRTPNLAPILSTIPQGAGVIYPVAAGLVDVATLDGTGYGCGTLPKGSLVGSIALIQRGPASAPCSFATKLNNAQQANAVAAVVYDDTPDEYVTMQVGSATLPAMFVTQADGGNLKILADESPGTSITLDFSEMIPFLSSPLVMANYSSAGPTPAGNLKPDLVAVGGAGRALVVTAEATSQAADPYQVASGTSISAPFVAGSIAVLMAARQGFSGQMYKSMVVNAADVMNVCDDASVPFGGLCADGTIVGPAGTQVAGAGKLDLVFAFETEMVSTPTAVNFGTGPGSVNLTLPITLENISLATDTYNVQVVPMDGSIVPTVDTPSFTLAQAATQVVNITLSGSGLAPGSVCDGFIVITGGTNPATTRVPYWYGVPGTSAKSVAVLNQQALTAGSAEGATVSILVRSVDAIGLPIAVGAPTVSAAGTKAKVGTIASVGDIPGTYQISVTLDTGGTTGSDTFVVTFGKASVSVLVPIG
jgi:minor extracellular serine protease Vpr